MTTEVRWPTDRFYWAVLDAPGIRADRGLPEGLLALLQDDLPVPVEEVNAVGAATADGKLIVCAARREALREVDPAVLRLSPEDIPALLEPKINPTDLNLLVGDFEPQPLRRERGKRHSLLALTTVLVACLLTVGLARRSEAWAKTSEQARSRAAALRTAAGPSPVALQVELDRLRKAPRADSKPLSSPDAAAALASLLATWPKELECQTESVSVAPTTMTLSVTVAKDPRPFLSALRPPDGWTMEEPRLTATSDGAHMRLVLHRKEARS